MKIFKFLKCFLPLLLVLVLLTSYTSAGWNPYTTHISSGTWQPTDIEGCTLWLRSDLGITKDAQDRVSVWADQSGNGNDASQATDSKKFVWYDNQINGYPALLADGIDDWMECPIILSQTIFVVVNHTDNAVFSYYRRVIDADDNDHWSIFGESGSSLYNAYGSYPRGITQANFWVNGINTGEASPLSNYKYLSAIATAQANNKIWLGIYSGMGDQCLMGYLVEVIIYNSPLSSVNRELVEGYLSGRYGI